MDPLRRQYPELTPYQFASNTPIQAIDLDGLERVDVTLWTNNGQIYKTRITVANAGTAVSNGNTYTPVNPNGIDGVRYRVYRDEDGGVLYSNTIPEQASFRYNNELANFQRYPINTDLTFNTFDPINNPTGNTNAPWVEFRESAVVSSTTTIETDNRELVEKQDEIRLYFEYNKDILKPGEAKKIKRPKGAVGKVDATLISATFFKAGQELESPTPTIGGVTKPANNIELAAGRDKVLFPLIKSRGFNLKSSEHLYEVSPSVPYSIRYSYQIWKGTKSTQTVTTPPVIQPFRNGMNFGTTTVGNTTTTIAPASTTISPRSTGTSGGTTIDF